MEGRYPSRTPDGRELYEGCRSVTGSLHVTPTSWNSGTPQPNSAAREAYEGRPAVGGSVGTPSSPVFRNWDFTPATEVNGFSQIFEKVLKEREALRASQRAAAVIGGQHPGNRYAGVSLGGVFTACFRSRRIGAGRKEDDSSKREVLSGKKRGGVAESNRLFAESVNVRSLEEMRTPSETRSPVFCIYNSLPSGTEQRRFSMAEILKATEEFSPSCKIGKGRLGPVYRGKLEDGTFIAVKRGNKISHDKNMGDMRAVHILSEISALLRLKHENLAMFHAYLECGNERFIVSEYVPNGTLREHLNGLKGTTLDLFARLDIAVDVASALTYLHTSSTRPIIHGDIKSSNVFLTENLQAKVVDFGFVHFPFSTREVTSYLDPEYRETQQLTWKSDVYNFGILLVELMSGKQPSELELTGQAIQHLVEDSALLLDPRLSQNPCTNLVFQYVRMLAWQCLAPSGLSRPSMKQCGEMLQSIRNSWSWISQTPPTSERLDSTGNR